MECKADWEAVQRRLVAWWHGEIVDRPCLQVTAPREGYEEQWLSSRTRAATTSLERWWTDIEFVVDRTARQIEATFWGGEAFPLFRPNIGPDAFAAFLGAPLRLLETTTWVEHTIEEWRQAPELRIDEDNRWWRLQLDLLRAGHEVGRGRWITGVPDTHAGGDALSALRGPSRLCLDLYDQPEVVKQALVQITEVARATYDAYFEILEPDVYGSSCSWLPCWFPGRSSAVQCDFIAFLSPAMVEEFILPAIVAEARCLDRAIFHLDGPDAIRHLDLLLAIPEIQAIQWVPGAGALPMTRWIPLLQRIQAGGKSLWLSATAAEVPVLLDALAPEGLMIHTSTDDERSARDLLAMVGRGS
jgi:hypothetical protein